MRDKRGRDNESQLYISSTINTLNFHKLYSFFVISLFVLQNTCGRTNRVDPGQTVP